MKVLAFFHNADADEKAVIYETTSFDEISPGLFEAVEADLVELDYNDAGGLFMVELPEEGDRPAVYGSQSGEIAVEFRTL